VRAYVAKHVGEVGDDLVVDALVEVHQVHLVDRQHEFGDAQQPGDARMSP